MPLLFDREEVLHCRAVGQQLLHMILYEYLTKVWRANKTIKCTVAAAAHLQPRRSYPRTKLSSYPTVRSRIGLTQHVSTSVLQIALSSAVTGSASSTMIQNLGLKVEERTWLQSNTIYLRMWHRTEPPIVQQSYLLWILPLVSITIGNGV